MRYILLFIFSCQLAAGFSQQTTFVKDSLDAYVNRELKRWNLPGASIAIVKDGKIIVSKGYGLADVKTGRKVDEQTLFMIASNTKLFTGTSLAMLAGEGRVGLTDKVVNWLPYFKMYNDTLTTMVTIEDILSHRLGFETFEGDFYNWDNIATRKQIIENIAKNKPVYDFRTTYGYCNAGFVTAGEVVHAVSDTTWEDFVAHHFFAPLGMRHTSIGYEKMKSDKNAAKPYTVFMDSLVELQYDNLDNIAPCAGINCSAEDFSHWLIMQADNGMYKGQQIVPVEAIENTRYPRSVAGDGHSGILASQHFDLYGLGCEISDYEGREIISHTGGANGFVTAVFIIPEERLGIAVFTNSDANYFFLAAAYQIMESYLNVPYRNLSSLYYNFFSRSTNQDNAGFSDLYATADKKPAPALAVNAYTGKYHNDVYGNMEIRQENGTLKMYFEHHPQLTGNLRALGGNDFVCTYDPISWGVKKIPFTVANNKVVSVTVTINDFIDFMPYEFIKQ